MGGGGRVEVISSKGCSGLFVGYSPSFRGLQPLKPMSPASSSVGSEQVAARSNAPFAGLIICVTGLSKETRKQVMEATERLGGQYSANLHPQCTHLVVQSFGGRKFEHALKHGSRNGLFIVTLGWFVDSVRKNVRLSELLYSVKNYGEIDMRLDESKRLVGFTSAENSCLPSSILAVKQVETFEEPQRFSGRESARTVDLTLSTCSIYIDSDISAELRNKVVEAVGREGANFVEQWFVGCTVSHVVCEGTSIRRYLGNTNNLVTPSWILKMAKEKQMQRLVHMSADLARQVSVMLEDIQNHIAGEETLRQTIQEDLQCVVSKSSFKERQQIVNSAKIGVRNRRGRRMQTCQTPIRPITPSNLLDSICWSISEPTSTASIYMDSFSGEDTSEHHSSIFFDANGKDSEASFANSTRPLTESEKSELILKNHFLTIIFPIDRFSEMGPSSRTFFSNNGFTCLQVLAFIYGFYQENLSAQEIEAAIHTDSRYADRLRSVYSSKETADRGYVIFKRIDFLGNRRSFEMLKRVSGENNCNVYELLLRA
ncbi:BRCT domain DNA repair protein [Quillaja saponaria]|uniref:BRCT domain DNA repair protein n=1 Tax=Quillaja saponaria TaxID=32244 RepID=A0AAD7LHW6_QUISA|nr:BRCT domain DNA repair protein [Quillaja saponaria]KAJ7958430.1 BRCT domain DNA repair protein [Quillaja saponaria]